MRVDVRDKDENKKLIGIGIVAVFIVLSFIGPHGGIITKPMSSALFLIGAALTMWTTQALPILPASLLILSLMPLNGLRANFTAALSGFTSSNSYFNIASIALGIVISRTSIPTKILAAMLAWSKGKVSRILLAFLLLSYSISMWVSDMGAVVLCLSFVTSFTDLIEDKESKSNQNLITMLGLSAPVGAVLGGNSNVVGSSVNIITLNMLARHTGGTITFVEWLIMGLPACFIAGFLIWRVMLLLFKADDLSEVQICDFVEKLRQFKSSLRNEKLTIVMILSIMFTWFISTWIPRLDLTIVGIFGMALFFLPRFGALTWKEFKAEMPWEVPFMGACAVGLGQVVGEVGLATLMSNQLAHIFPNLGPHSMVFVFSVFVTILVMGIPVGPAMASMMTVPGYLLAESVGLNPMANVMVVGIFAANSCILPLNATFLVPFSRGMFKLKDCVKTGICLSLIWIILCTIWLPITTGWLYPM